MLVRISLLPREPRRILRELVCGNVTLKNCGILPLGYEDDGRGHGAISVPRIQAVRAVGILRAAGFRVTAIRQAWIPRARRHPLRMASVRTPRTAPPL